MKKSNGKTPNSNPLIIISIFLITKRFVLFININTLIRWEQSRVMLPLNCLKTQSSLIRHYKSIKHISGFHNSLPFRKYNNMAPQIERLTESFVLGEGPHWDIPSQSLYFLDCASKYLVKYNPATKKVSKALAAPKQPSFIIPVEGKKDQFVISLDKELVIVSWDGESDKFTIVEKLCVADDTPEKAANKFNDAKCDSSGRLWAGTLCINQADIDQTLPVGTLYSFDSKRQLKAHVSQVRLTNGLAFNDQAKKMYYIDTLKRTIDQFDFDIVNGAVSNRQVLFSLEKNNITGGPDGMTIDSDGNLWVAVFGGSRVIKIDGKKPETLLDTIHMPALQVTSMTFGGPNLDELYVTTACITSRGARPPTPENGATYRITGTGSKGLPAANFKLN